MATSLTLENDSSLAQGYIKVNGSIAATLTTSGITANVTGTASNVADGAITAAKLNGGQTGSAPIYGCRAWVNFDGTRDTTGAVSTANTNRLIRASGNVASVLRNAAGDYTITFTIPMSDANYSVTLGWEYRSANTNSGGFTSATNQASSCKVFTASGGAAYDPSVIMIQIFR